MIGCKMSFLTFAGDLTLEDLLSFIFGAPYFPSMTPTRVNFSTPDANHTMPITHLCSQELILPTVHTKYGDFRDAMTKAVEYSGVGFGLR